MENNSYQDTEYPLSKSEGKTNKYETEKECSYQELILLSRANPTIHYPKTHVMQQRKP